MIAPLPVVVRRELDWRDPMAVAAAVNGRRGALALVSGGTRPGRSWVAAEPDLIWTEAEAGDDLFRPLRDEAALAGVVGLAAYDAGARAATGPRARIWPDLILARYPARLLFDAGARTLTAIGRGRTTAEAQAAAGRAAAWAAMAPADARTPGPPSPPALAFTPERPGEAYEAAVADVVSRIAAGELFQANVARAWSGALEAERDPFDVFLRLAGRGADYGAWWRLGDRAVVSNSPELFLSFDPGRRWVETRPIKGTRPRLDDAEADAAQAEALGASVKDRAENLMIVDLMRNDLARVCAPGSVKVEALFALERLPTVHHLTSTVSGAVREGAGAAEVLAAAFPPGSITGAPKHQAMKVIAAHEPPRGAWCGSLFVIDDEGRMEASVLIRTAAFERREGVWRFRALAGAGIVADSDPAQERAETGAKIRALREALTGAASGV